MSPARVFEHPSSGSADRRRYRREIERKYMPWRRYDGNAFPEKQAEMLKQKLLTQRKYAKTPPAGGVFYMLQSLVQGLQQEAHRAEAVVAGDHGGSWVLHPAVVEILRPVGQGHHEG